VQAALACDPESGPLLRSWQALPCALARAVADCFEGFRRKLEALPSFPPAWALLTAAKSTLPLPHSQVRTLRYIFVLSGRYLYFWVRTFRYILVLLGTYFQVRALSYRMLYGSLWCTQ